MFLKTLALIYGFLLDRDFSVGRIRKLRSGKLGKSTSEVSESDEFLTSPNTIMPLLELI